MPFLLMVFLTFVCFPDLGKWDPPLWAMTPLESAILTALLVGLPVVYLASVSRWVAFRLCRDPSRRDRVLLFFERTRVRNQLLLFVSFIVSLCVLGWGWALAHFWRGESGIWPGAELILLAPYLLGLVLSWCVTYDADRAAYESAHGCWNAIRSRGRWTSRYARTPHSAPAAIMCSSRCGRSWPLSSFRSACWCC